MAGLATVPVVVRETSDQSSVEEALVENLHRKDLTPLEEAGAYQQLISDFKLTHEQVAGRVGKSRAVITNTLRLLDLPPKVQKYLAMGEIGSGHGKVLLGIADNGTVENLAKQCVDEGWTVRQLEDAVHNASGRTGIKPKPIRPVSPGSVRDAALVELESLLGEHLSTNVAVSLSGKRGKIVIDFADIADLERIYRLMA
jgi:ParB family chromosome partitioning protein